MSALFPLFILFAIVVFLALFTYFIPVGLWISAYFARVKVRIADLIGMRLRKVPPSGIIGPRIAGIRSGLTYLTTAQLEDASLEVVMHEGGTVQGFVVDHEGNLWVTEGSGGRREH